MKKLIPASVLASTVLILGLGAAPASAAISPPEAASTDLSCDATSDLLSVTGLVGDTFTVHNTSAVSTCTLLNFAAIVSASDGSASVTTIAPLTTVTFTIVGPGLFPVQFGNLGLGGIQVTIADPEPEPEPEPEVESGASDRSLPNTGGPDGSVIAISALAGIALVGAGIATVTRRRRHTS